MKYIHKPHTSKLASLIISFPAGSRVEYQAPYPKGIAHFMEHYRFKETTEFNSKDLTRFVAYYGGMSNAFTSCDLVNYHITIPEENIEHGIKALTQIAFHPTFPEHELQKEKDVVCQEVRLCEEEIDDAIAKNMNSKIFKNSIDHSRI